MHGQMAALLGLLALRTAAAADSSSGLELARRQGGGYDLLVDGEVSGLVYNAFSLK